MQKKLNITFIYVTHDQEEAMTMSDRVAIMSEGLILQIDKPMEIYNRPTTRFVADFIGESNIFEGVVENKVGDTLYVRTPSGSCIVNGPEFEVNEKIFVSVRPEYMMIDEKPIEDFTLKATMTDLVYMGTLAKAILSTADGHEIKYSRFELGSMLGIGKEVYLYWNPEKAVAIKQDTMNERTV